MTEKEMVELHPSPKTRKELNAFLSSLERELHKADCNEENYGKAAHAMALAALAAFNYMAHKLGTTGFQAGYAGLEFFQKSRYIKHGIRVLSLDDLMFPQCASSSDHFPTMRRLLRDNAPWLAVEAKKRLKEERNAHPRVRSWWRELAKLNDGRRGGK